MRVGIIGSRDCKNLTIEKIAEFLPQNCTEIVSGGAAGVDTLAAELAKLKNIPLRVYPPDYEKYGKQAPLKRNLQIVEHCDHLSPFGTVIPAVRRLQ